MSIRALHPARDEVQIAEICRQLMGPHFSWPNEKLKSELQSGVQGLVYEFQNRVEAFLLYRESVEVLEITALGVAPRCQRSGKMGGLISGLIDAYSKQKELWLEVHEQNLAARNFYEKWGFTAVGRRPKYYPDGAAAILYSHHTHKSS